MRVRSNGLFGRPLIVFPLAGAESVSLSASIRAAPPTAGSSGSALPL